MIRPRTNLTMSGSASVRARGRGARAGMTLLEVVTVVAIALLLTAVAMPGLSALFSLKQRAAASELAVTYSFIHDEAVLRNQTYRVAFHLDGGWYQVEAGDPDTLIFADEAQREDFERARASKLSDPKAYTGEDPGEGFDPAELSGGGRHDLPSQTRFGGVWTPQYDRMQEPSGADEEDPEDPLVVYSYVFPNGFSEPAVVHLVSGKDDRVGFSVVVEPMTGDVRMVPELVRVRDAFPDVPETGPDLPQ